MSSPTPSSGRSLRIVVVCLLVTGAFVATFVIASRLLPPFSHLNWGSWFGLDGPTYTDMLRGRHAVGHFETRRHPLISFAVFGPVWLLLRLGLSIEAGVDLFVSLVAAAWAGALVWSCREAGASFTPSVCAAGLVVGSGAFLAYGPALESVNLSGLALALSLALGFRAVRSEGKTRVVGARWEPDPELLGAAAVVCGLAMTHLLVVPVGLVLVVRFGVARSGRMMAMGLGFVALVYGIQSLIFPGNIYFITGSGVKETLRLFSGGPFFRMTAPLQSLAGGLLPGKPADPHSDGIVPLPFQTPGNLGRGFLLIGLGLVVVFVIVHRSPSTAPSSRVSRLVILPPLGIAVLISAVGWEPFLYSPVLLTAMAPTLAWTLTRTAWRKPKMAVIGAFAVCFLVLNGLWVAEAARHVPTCSPGPCRIP